MKLANRNVLISAGVLAVLMLTTNPTKDAYLDTLLTDQEVVTRSAQYICAKSGRSMFFSKIEDCPPAVAQDKATIKQFLDSRSYRSNFILFSGYRTEIPIIHSTPPGDGEVRSNSIGRVSMGILGNFSGESNFFTFIAATLFSYEGNIIGSTVLALLFLALFFIIIIGILTSCLRLVLRLITVLKEKNFL